MPIAIETGNDGDNAVRDPFPILVLDFKDAGDFLRVRSCADQPHQPGHLNLPVVFRRGLVDAGNELESCGRGLGVPHGFDRRHLGLLRFTHGIA